MKNPRLLRYFALIVILLSYAQAGHSQELICPAPTTIEVAPSCTTNYIFEISTTSPLPPGYTISPFPTSGTPLSEGVHNYSAQLVDDNGNVIDVCRWTVTVVESPNVGVEFTCLDGPIILDFPQTAPFEQTVDVTDFLDNTPCSDLSLFTISASINGIEYAPAPSVTFTENEVNQNIDITITGPNGISTCATVLFLDGGDLFPTIPTLSQWALLILALLLASFAVARIRIKETVEASL